MAERLLMKHFRCSGKVVAGEAPAFGDEQVLRAVFEGEVSS